MHTMKQADQRKPRVTRATDLELVQLPRNDDAAWLQGFGAIRIALAIADAFAVFSK
jgi:hypothetical protein